jgi:hypothetical protein
MGNAFQQAARRAARKNLPFEIALVLVRFDHVASRIVNADHSKTTRSLLHDAVKL